MMQLLASIEGSALSVWVRESPTVWAYPTILTLHTFGMGVLAGACWTLDLRVLGVGRHLPLRPLRTLFPVMWTGFWVNAITGSLLFASSATEKAASKLFLTKLFLIALGVVATVMLKREIYGGNDGDTATTITGKTKLLAIASLLLWLSAIMAGRLLAYLAT